MNGYMRLSTAKTRIAAAKDALFSAQLAEAAAERAAKHHPRGGALNLAKTRLLVGNLLWLEGDMQSAWNRYQEAVSTLEQLVNAEPDSTTFLENLAEAYRRSGDLQGNAAYFHFGNSDRANVFQRKALAIAQRLSARDPEGRLGAFASEYRIAPHGGGAARQETRGGDQVLSRFPRGIAEPHD